MNYFRVSLPIVFNFLVMSITAGSAFEFYRSVVAVTASRGSWLKDVSTEWICSAKHALRHARTKHNKTNDTCVRLVRRLLTQALNQ